MKCENCRQDSDKALLEKKEKTINRLVFAVIVLSVAIILLTFTLINIL